MQILRHYEHVPPGLQGGVYALGNFDGVHRGHRQVIGRAAEIANELGVPLGVLVFEPHPQQFFFPDRPFFRLTPFRAKARLLEKLGVDVLAALPFDARMSQKLAPEFVLDVLVEGLRAVHVVAGYDFRFGKARGGDAAALSYMGGMEGFGVSIVDEVRDGGQAYSRPASARAWRKAIRAAPKLPACGPGNALPAFQRGRTTVSDRQSAA